MKLNRNFAKLKTDMTLDFMPIPLKVVIHHHEEADVPVLDPETGEPTGETEHVVRDWDTTEIKVRPTAADSRQTGYKPVDYGYVPVEPAPEGKEWTRTGRFVEADGTLRPEYRATDIPTPPPRTYSKYRLVLALQNEGVWDRVKAWLESIPGAWDLYLAAEDISGDEQLLESGVEAAKDAFGWTDAKVAEILASAEVG